MIGIDYCGYHTHNQDKDIIYRKNGTSSYLFLLILSPMVFHFEDNSSEKAGSGACILYQPYKYQYYAAEKDFFNSYVHFTCTTEMLAKYQLRYNKIFYPANVEDLNWLIKKIHQEYIGRLPDWEEMADMYVRQLLIGLSRQEQQAVGSGDEKKQLYEEFHALRQQIMSRCELPWSIEQICKILNIGKSQLYTYYKAFFHSTPKEDLIQARLQKAKYLMNNDAITIKQAAYQSGFQNIYHFNRLFKTRFSCSPGEYKKRLK